MSLARQWAGWKGLDPDTKFGNTPDRCRQGAFHQSKLEARRCDELHLLQTGGEITELRAHPQPLYRLDVNGRHVTTYRGDFEYTDRDGNLVTEDAKGMLTDVFRIKVALFEAILGREVVLVRQARGVRGRR